jgi:hypothetical protein
MNISHFGENHRFRQQNDGEVIDSSKKYHQESENANSSMFAGNRH